MKTTIMIPNGVHLFHTDGSRRTEPCQNEVTNQTGKYDDGPVQIDRKWFGAFFIQS